MSAVILPTGSSERATIERARVSANRQKMAVTDVNGKESITHFEVLERFKNNTLVKCTLDTGRTHQIRVHFAYINHPVTNDPLYGKEKIKDFGQFLHSTSIEFDHPFTKKHIYYEVKRPKEFDDFIDSIKGELVSKKIEAEVAGENETAKAMNSMKSFAESASEL